MPRARRRPKPRRKKTTRATKAPKTAKGANEAKPKKAAAEKKAAPNQQPSAARKGTKAAKVLELVRRPSGATVKEIMKATGWQAHSVRGFISTISKNQGLGIESAKREDGERAYCLPK